MGDPGAARRKGVLLIVVVLRRMRTTVDMVPPVMIAGLVSIAVALPFAWPLAPTPSELALAGGVIVFGALAANEWVGLRQGPSDRPG